MTKCPFLGGYGVGRSTNAADSQLINLYLEFSDSHEGKQPAAFYMTPGLTQLVTVGTGPISGYNVMGSTLYVVSNSTLYSVSPSLTVTSLGSVGAAALSMINNGTQLMIVTGTAAYLYGPTYAIASITVDVPGSNYTSPTISFTGGGGSGGALATATLIGSISGVTVSAGGVYATTPAITFSGGSPSTPATATATLGTSGSVTSIAVSSGGTGYSGTVTVSLVGGGGTGATATATVSGGIITVLNVTAGGTGYSSAPTVVITNATGSGAGGQAVLGFPISTVSMVQNGIGYTGIPTVATTGGGQTTAATLVGVLSYSIATITPTSGHLGAYNSAPTVVITDSTGTAATAHANLSPTSLGNTVSPVVLPFSSPFFAYNLSYQDGFGLLITLFSNKIWQSNLLDLSTWDPLSFSAADSTPTYAIAIEEKQREQWIFKTDCTEVWINAGLAGFAFQRLEGVFIEYGCAAPSTVAKIGNSLIWMTQNNEGYASIMLANGYEPQRVSTYDIEVAINGGAPLSTASAYTYIDSGHEYYCLTLPNANSGAGATFCLDLTATKFLGFPFWQQRASGTIGSFTQHLAQKCLFWNRELASQSAINVVGDGTSNKLYYYDSTNATDNGASRSWVRSFRAVKESSFAPRPFESLQVDMETGIAITGTPTISLSWSDDGGHNFSPSMSAIVGASGQTSIPVKFNSLGSTTLQNGLDRIFQITSTLSTSSKYTVALMGADIMP